MAIGTSPYNFVPLNEHIFFPEWADKISMDIPFEDGEDGIIEVEWTNDSPLFIRDVQNSNDKDAKENQYSMHIMKPDGTRLYFLPGSSLRGMLRSVLSILSFGKMDQYDNQLFGYREFGGKAYSNQIPYQNNMKKIRYGWLEKKGENNYILYTRGKEYWAEHNLNDLYRRLQKAKSETKEIEENALAINIADIEEMFPGYKRQKDPSAWKQNIFFKEKYNSLFPTYIGENGEKYNIFTTGYMNGKNHEVLIPALRKDDEVKELNPTVVDRFKEVYAPTPDFNEFITLLDNGERIPVSFILGNKKEVETIGMGRMIRNPYKYNIKQLVEKQQKFDDNKADLCETIFGWIDKNRENKSMKGRVQVGNAFAQKSIADNELHIEKGVLGEPKASYYPYYIKQNGGTYLTFDNDTAVISGRKWYRIHKGDSTMPLPRNEENENVEIKFKPIPAGQTFKMHINVHNLKKMEVGALLFAITLHKQSRVWHNIGLAKSFGFGKLHCDYNSIKLNGFTNKDPHHYIAAFVYEMNKFTKNSCHEEWLETEQTNSLFSIMSEHSDDEVQMMKLDEKVNEYRDTKKNDKFHPLKEKRFHTQEVLTDDDKNEFEAIERKKQKEEREKQEEEKRKERERQFLKEHQAEYEKIKKWENSKDPSELKTAINILDQLISKRGQEELIIETQEDEEWKKKIEKRLEEIIVGINANQSLSNVLEEKYPNKDEYKVKEVKVLVQKWVKWMKTHDFDDTSKATLIRNLNRVKTYDDKKYQKQWKQNEKIILKYLTPEEIDSI